MRTYLLITVSIAALSGCSSTLVYEATGAYSIGPGDNIQQFDDLTACEDSSNGDCQPIKLSWRTERFCGIYRSAGDAVSDRNLRVANSPTTNEGWEDVDGETVLLGDDEDYQPVPDSDNVDGTDVLCGRFLPPRQLVNVTRQETLNLLISCESLVSTVKLMPPLSTPYPLRVDVVDQHHTLIGCSTE